MRTFPGLLSLRARCSAHSLPSQPTQQWTRAPVRVCISYKSFSTSWDCAQGLPGDGRLVRSTCSIAPHALSQRPVGAPTAAAAPLAPTALPGPGPAAQLPAPQPSTSAAAHSPALPNLPMTSGVDHATAASTTAAPVFHDSAPPATTSCAAAASAAAANGHTAAPAACGAGNQPHGPPGAFGPPYDQVIRSDFLGPGPLPGNRRVYLVVLNYCLPAGLLHAWSRACFRICADGGCNRLHDELPSMMPPPPAAIAATAAEAEAKSEEEQVPSSNPSARTSAGAATAPSGAGTATSTCGYNHAQENGHANGHSSGSDGNRSANGIVRTNGAQQQPSQSQHSQQQPQPHQHQYHNTPPPGTLGAGGLGAGGGDASGSVGAPSLDIAASLRLAHMPDVVLGDLDSLRPDVRWFYVRHGVPFLDMSYDQDTNDLAKAVAMIEERFIRTDPEGRADRHQILVLGALGGRLDHTLANLNVLHMFPHLDIALWGDGNLVRLVRPGRTLIVPDERFEGPTCGLIPIAGPVTASSTGLRWNVDSTLMRVGGLVSSSNLLTGSSIEVACDGPLLWSTEVREEPRPDLQGLWARTAAAAAAAAAVAAAAAAAVAAAAAAAGAEPSRNGAETA